MSLPVVRSGSDEECDNFYKAQLEIANKEKMQLQERLKVSENRNMMLKKAVFELSMSPQRALLSQGLPLDVLQIIREMSISEKYSTSMGKGSAYRRVSPDERAASCGKIYPHVGFGSGDGPKAVPFVRKATLKGHSGAVYAVQFSPNGQLLASTSFDRSLCIWAMNKYLDESNCEPRIQIADAHRSQVVAVEWACASTHVVTGGFDQYASEWDISSGEDQAVTRNPCYGLVNAVSVSPANDSLFFACTSHGVVHLFDRRVPPQSGRGPNDPTIILKNDEVVNSLNVQLDGRRFFTGDTGGAIRTWDLRMMPKLSSTDFPNISNSYQASLFHTTYNDDNRQPITHVHSSPPAGADNHGRFMAVNSYDNCLRVYDRGSFIFESEKAELELIHVLEGPTYKNWPIKSSFFLGADYKPPRLSTPRKSTGSRNRASQVQPGVAAAGGNGDADLRPGTSSEERDDEESTSSESSSEDEINGHEDAARRHSRHWRPGGPIRSTMTLATGSADGCIYIFDVGGRPGTGVLVQRLEEHRDRVYGVDFHPSKPILASCSADSEIKIWGTSQGISSDY